MAATLVDSNVLIDVISGDARWESWSSEALATVASEGLVVINPLVYAEVSIGFARIESCESALDLLHLEREALPWPASFLAGRAFAEYRRRGGERRSPLPDFFIGAHAAVRGMGLLTRDAGRYRTSFPRLRLISPDLAHRRSRPPDATRGPRR